MGPIGRHCSNAAVNTACLTQSQFAVTTSSNLTTQKDWGNYQPNSFFTAGYFDLDTQFTKAARISEQMRFEIGTNIYNTFNHTNFSTPSGSVTSATLGTITSTQSAPVSIYGSGQGAIVSGRVVVLTGKLTF